MSKATRKVRDRFAEIGAIGAALAAAPPDYDKVVISQLARILGRRGAKVTNSRLSAQQRSENARRAVRLRWQRHRERLTHEKA